MPSPTRADLEQAARAFFEELVEEVDQPRSFNLDEIDEHVAMNVEHSRERISDLDDELKANKFGGVVTERAIELVQRCGSEFAELSSREQLLALKLAARAEREQMAFFVHSLTQPARRFRPTDELFREKPPAASSHRRSASPAPLPAASGMALSKAVTIYLARKTTKGLSQSQVDEVGRALGWLQERLGADRALNTISKAEMRKFRDDIARLDVTLRGRGAPFEARLTSDPAEQIKSVTALRYWKSVQSFFSWLAAEEHAAEDPTAGLVLDTKKGEVKRSPPPFSQEELQRLFRTPLYAGYKSRSRLADLGDCHVREGHWWAGVLLMHTGLRAGELSQFLPADFVFDAEVPHLKVRNVDDAGQRVKTTKNAASVRDLPLSPVLLELGLAEFVQRRAKMHQADRVFREFRLGARGRTSDGMTKFWGNYLKKFGLWKEGRATHVWRHTLIQQLRLSGSTREEIAAVVGHAGRNITDSYGGAFPLSRKFETISKLDFGFDVVAAVGGPFDPERHG